MIPHRSGLSRRRFIQTAAVAAAAGSAIGMGVSSRRIFGAPADARTGENEHFFYRPAPDGPYIDTQRDHKAFGFGDGKIYLSEDNAKSWAHSAEFPEAQNITFSVILKNGNILFATREKLFFSTDNLKSHRQIIVKNRDGGDYLPHTPKNPQEPGWYFHSLDGVHEWDVEGKPMLVWGNYCNVIGGAVPVNIYYSTDNGQIVKIAYSFGRNPNYQEPGADGAAFLGDASNPIICRHIHNVMFNPAERAFYACTGDHSHSPTVHECHWLRGTYDAKGDKWEWKVIVSTDSNSRYKSGGINFVDNQIYWAADANGQKAADGSYDRGIFRCAPADIADTSKHTRLFNARFEMANMIIQDRFMLAGHCAPATTLACGFAVSPNLGKTWTEYDLSAYGSRSPLRFNQKNADGWFRIDLRKGWIDRGEVMFIKPKA